MRAGRSLTGCFAASITPFTASGAVDHVKLVQQSKWLLSHGCQGLAPMGTTGEGSSLSARQKISVIDTLANASLPLEDMIVGTGACALEEAITVSKHAVKNGSGGVLMMPPFYYKNPTEDGLYSFFSRVVEGVDDPDLRVYLYHFPQMTSVPVSPELIGRLRESFPETFRGLKDSSGVWEYSKELIERFPGFHVFSGTEAFLLRNLQHGGVGCISASANFTCPLAGKVHEMYFAGDVQAAAALQEGLTEVRLLMQDYPLLGAVKALKARAEGNDASWTYALPPHHALSAEDAGALVARLQETSAGSQLLE